jgi:hypothetical protein
MTPTHVVQFTSLRDFMRDLTSSEHEPMAIYHALIEQRTSVGSHGTSRWQLTTIIRAVVAAVRPYHSELLHTAALTFAHGAPVDKLYGRLLAAPGDDERHERARGDTAQLAHGALLYTLNDALIEAGLTDLPNINGILHVPTDLPLVYADDTEAREYLKWERTTMADALRRVGLTDQADRLLAQITADEQQPADLEALWAARLQAADAEADAAGEVEFYPGGDGSPG